MNDRLADRDILVSCEVGIYDALSESIGTYASQNAVTLSDINDSVPADLYNGDIKGNYDYGQRETSVGLHCSNASSRKLSFCEVKYQPIMTRAPLGKVIQGTLESGIVPGDITFYRLQSVADNVLRAHVVQDEVFPAATHSFGAIGISAIPGMNRFYRHILVEKDFPHYGAVAFGHYGETTYKVFKYIDVDVEKIRFNQPKGMLYRTENPFT